MLPPSMKLDILVGEASILGKLMLVLRLGSSRLGFLISRLPGLGSFLSLDTLAGAGFSLPDPSTRCEPPGGGFGSILEGDTLLWHHLHSGTAFWGHSIKVTTLFFKLLE